MKIIIFLLLSAIIFLAKSTQALPDCNMKLVKQDFIPVSFEQISIDGSFQKPIVTRFFHNKIGIQGQEIAQCYFNAVEGEFLFKNIGVVGTIFIMAFFYKLVVKKKWIFLLLALCVPILPFFGLTQPILIIIYKIFAIIGLALILFSK